MNGVATPSIGPTIEELDAEVERWTKQAQSWRWFVRQFQGNWSLFLGLGVLLGYLAVAMLAVGEFGATLTRPPFHPDWAEAIPPPGPTWAHPFGIMSGIGVDGFTEVFRAFPIDLGVVFLAIGSAGVVGVVVGAAAAVRGGGWETLVGFLSDVEAAMPPFFFVVVLYLGLALWIPPAYHLLAFPLLFGIVLWPYYARPVRAVAKQVVGEPYVEGARAAGASGGHILLRHVLPNSVSPALAQAPADVYSIFFVLTVFPYLSCSSGGTYNAFTPLPSPFFPEWGSLLAQGTCYGFSIVSPPGFWWMYLFPLLAILGLGVGVAFTCDGIERWLSTRRRA